MARRPLIALAAGRHTPRLAAVAGVVFTIATLAGLGLAAWTLARLSTAAAPSRDDAATRLAEAARESRYLLTAIRSGTPGDRATGAPYLASSLERLRAAADAAGDADAASLVRSLPTQPAARADATTALLDAVAARAERLATAAMLDASAKAAWDATRLGRLGLAGSSVAALAALGLLLTLAATMSAYRRAIAGAIPDDTPGATDADRVGWLAGRLSRARRIAERGKLSFDDVSTELVASRAEGRARQQLVESQGETIREQKNALLKDRMTELWNTYFLKAQIKLAVEAYLDEGEPFCVLALDLNKFKSINETYGHSAGDIAIREVARVIADHCRADDTGARRGGDEFMVLLPKTTAEDGLVVAERLRAAVNGHVLRNVETNDGRADIGVSTTVGMFAVETGDRDELEHVRDDVDYDDNRAITHVMRSADRAQEYGKYLRADRVCVYSTDVDTYLSTIELPPNWDHFVRHAGRVYNGLDEETRDMFLANYDHLVRLTRTHDLTDTGNQSIH